MVESNVRLEGHDALGFDQLIEIGCTFHSIWLPRAFHFMIMAHFPQQRIFSLFWNRINRRIEKSIVGVSTSRPIGMEARPGG